MKTSILAPSVLEIMHSRMTSLVLNDVRFPDEDEDIIDDEDPSFEGDEDFEYVDDDGEMDDFDFLDDQMPDEDDEDFEEEEEEYSVRPKGRHGNWRENDY